mgnify:CR=1
MTKRGLRCEGFVPASGSCEMLWKRDASEQGGSSLAVFAAECSIAPEETSYQQRRSREQ